MLHACAKQSRPSWLFFIIYFLYITYIFYPIFQPLGEGLEKLKELGHILSLCIQVDSKKALSMWVLQAPWEFHPCLLNHFCLSIKHTFPLQHFGCKQNEMNI